MLHKTFKFIFYFKDVKDATMARDTKARFDEIASRNILFVFNIPLKK